MIDKIEDYYDNNSSEDAELWELLGYSSKEEYEIEEAKEKQKALEQSYKDEDEIRKAIENGEYYDPEELEKELAFQIQQDMERANKEFAEFQAKKEVTFDDIIDKFAPDLIGLKGESYKSATKMVFYSVLANQIKKNYFTVDNKKIDLRIPLLIMMKAGHGKKGYEQFIKNTVHGLGKEYSEPTSYHPEQFIGKVDKAKDDDFFTQIPGYFNSDYILIDEAYELLSSPKEEYKETLKYIRTALDPIGNNEIEKKQVGIPYANRLHYFPECTVSLMTQPISEVNEELLTRGSFRRFVIIMINTPLEERMIARRESEFLTNTEEINKKRWESWLRSNQNLTNLKLKFVGNKADFVLIDNYIDKLINELKFDNSQEALEFANSIQYNIKYLIFKMAIVRAVVEQMVNNIEITRRHIEKAIEDFNITWQPQVSWIRRKMTIISDKPKDWKDIHNWIYENLKISSRLQSDVINKWVEKNTGLFKDTTLREYAKRAIKDMKKWGYIIDEPTGDKNNKLLRLISNKD